MTHFSPGKFDILFEFKCYEFQVNTVYSGQGLDGISHKIKCILENNNDLTLRIIQFSI